MSHSSSFPHVPHPARSCCTLPLSLPHSLTRSSFSLPLQLTCHVLLRTHLTHSPHSLPSPTHSLTVSSPTRPICFSTRSIQTTARLLSTLHCSSAWTPSTDSLPLGMPRFAFGGACSASRPRCRPSSPLWSSWQRSRWACSVCVGGGGGGGGPAALFLR
jgi:hypothetical protein